MIITGGKPLVLNNGWGMEEGWSVKRWVLPTIKDAPSEEELKKASVG